MKNNEIREANRKALPKLLALLAILLTVGFALGFLAAKYGLNELSGVLKKAGSFFGMNVAPWLMVLLAAAVPIICVPVYRSAKKLLGVWDGEDEAVYDTVDRKLSAVMWIAGAAMIVAYFLMAAAYSGAAALLADGNAPVWYFTAVAAFIAGAVEMLILGQKCVDAAKEMAPEKKASFYDMQFQKKWIEDCDEAEKIRIGRCAYKAYSATNRVCAVSAGVLAVCALIFDIGFLPSLAICTVWIVNQSVYCKEAMRYARAGNKIS